MKTKIIHHMSENLDLPEVLFSVRTVSLLGFVVKQEIIFYL